MGVGYAGRCLDLLSRRRFDSKCYVVENGVVKEDRVLVDIADEFAQVVQADVPDIRAVYAYAAAVRIIKTRNEVNQGGLAGSGCADYSDGLAFFDVQVDVLENLASVLVAERNVPEADPVLEAVYVDRLFRLLDMVLGIEYKVYALHACKTFRYAVRSLGKVLDRLDDAVEYSHIAHKCRCVYDGLFSEYERASEPEHHCNHNRADKLGYRMSAGLPNGYLAVLASHGSRYAVKTLLHLVFGYERLDDAQAAEGLLDLTHSVGPVLLSFGGVGFETASYHTHHPDDKRGKQYCKECKLPGLVE